MQYRRTCEAQWKRACPITDVCGSKPRSATMKRGLSGVVAVSQNKDLTARTLVLRYVFRVRFVVGLKSNNKRVLLLDLRVPTT